MSKRELRTFAKACCIRSGWESTCTDNGDRIEAAADLNNEKNCRVDLRIREDDLTAYCYFPLRAEEAVRAAVCECLMRLNAHLTIGGLELSFKDGAIRCKTNLLCGKNAPDHNAVWNCIHACTNQLDCCAPYIRRVMFEGASPEAVEEEFAQAQRAAQLARIKRRVEWVHGLVENEREYDWKAIEKEIEEMFLRAKED